MLLIGSSEPSIAQRLLDECWVSEASSYADLVAAADRLLTEINEFDKVWPWVDEYGTVHRGDIAVPLTRPEAIVLKELLRNEGRVVPRAQLGRLLELNGNHGGRALEGAIYRLRMRLSGMRLVVRAARSQGFAIDVLGRTDIAV